MYSIDMSPLKLCTELQIMFFECIIWSWGNTFLCRGQDRDSVRRAKVKSYTVYPVWLESINHKKNLAYLAKKKKPLKIEILKVLLSFGKTLSGFHLFKECPTLEMS